MKSIRTKTTFLTVILVIAAVIITTILGVTAVRNVGRSSSEQILQLLCETGEKNLDAYFTDIEQSVELVSTFADEDLATIEEPDAKHLQEHMERVSSLFEKTAYNTLGVLTYYYRVDPEFTEDVDGFWYVNLDGDGFVEHEVTDITQYDTDDTSSLVWFTVPKSTGSSIWLPPYITENLDTRVLSYNVPIYWNDRFFGVIGIELDYSTMANEVDHITLFDNGYAFINDDEGNIVYHPYMETTELSGANKPVVPDGLLTADPIFRYTYDGIEKEGAWQPLSNGMRLNVTVPVSEINGSWVQLIITILIVSLIVVIVVILLCRQFAGHITRPLSDLAKAAEEVDKGNYDVALNYDGKDEVGILTRSFNQLTGHLKVYIHDLNDLAYADALTSVRNKGAYDIFIRELQEKLTKSEGKIEFAIGYFDCDDLKHINDRFGHERGNVYLKKASHLICRVFRHSPVFRTGGDEFATIIQNDDFWDLKELTLRFEEDSAKINDHAHNEWDQVHVAMGIAVYDPASDTCVKDVERRADEKMYENKRLRKANNQNETSDR